MIGKLRGILDVIECLDPTGQEIVQHGRNCFVPHRRRQAVKVGRGWARRGMWLLILPYVAESTAWQKGILFRSRHRTERQARMSSMPCTCTPRRMPRSWQHCSRAGVSRCPPHNHKVLALSGHHGDESFGGKRRNRSLFCPTGWATWWQAVSLVGRAARRGPSPRKGASNLLAQPCLPPA